MPPKAKPASAKGMKTGENPSKNPIRRDGEVNTGEKQLDTTIEKPEQESKDAKAAKGSPTGEKRQAAATTANNYDGK